MAPKRRQEAESSLQKKQKLSEKSNNDKAPLLGQWNELQTIVQDFRKHHKSNCNPNHCNCHLQPICKIIIPTFKERYTFITNKFTNTKISVQLFKVDIEFHNNILAMLTFQTLVRPIQYFEFLMYLDHYQCTLFTYQDDRDKSETCDYFLNDFQDPVSRWICQFDPQITIILFEYFPAVISRLIIDQFHLA